MDFCFERAIARESEEETCAFEGEEEAGEEGEEEEEQEVEGEATGEVVLGGVDAVPRREGLVHTGGDDDAELVAAGVTGECVWRKQDRDAPDEEKSREEVVEKEEASHDARVQEESVLSSDPLAMEVVGEEDEEE